MGDQHTMTAVTPAARVPPTPLAVPSAAAELRLLAARFEAGELKRPDYIAERNRIRSNWSKTPPPPVSAPAGHDHQYVFSFVCLQVFPSLCAPTLRLYAVASAGPDPGRSHFDFQHPILECKFEHKSCLAW